MIGIPQTGIMGMQKSGIIGKRNQAGLTRGSGGINQGVMKVAVQGRFEGPALNQGSKPKPWGP